MLLNIPANLDGLLSDKDCSVAKAFGAEIQRRFSRPLASVVASGRVITLTLPKPMNINTVILQEDIANGERVREYRLEGRVGPAWKLLGTGSAIGHKRIQPVVPVIVDAVRLVSTKYVETPMMCTLSVFDTGVAPPADWNSPSEVWAANLVGDWNDHSFSLDLTSQVNAAAQYRLHFVPKNGPVTAIYNVVLKLHGVPEPALVKRDKQKPDDLILDITGVAETIQLNGQIEGSASGQILMQKL